MISRSGVSFTGIATMLPTRWTAGGNGASFLMPSAGSLIEGIAKHKS